MRASIVDFVDGSSIAFTPAGAYAGSADIAARVNWVFDATMGTSEAFSFEQFARFHDPAIVKRRLKGENVDTQSALVRPPQVKSDLVSTSADGKASMRVHVESKSRVDVLRGFVEGRNVFEKPVCAPSTNMTVDMPLLPGSNVVTFAAFDDRGAASNRTRSDVMMNVNTNANANPNAKANAYANANKADLYIVSIGVNRYPHLPPDMQLGYAAADAEGIAHAFSELGGANGMYRYVRRTVLTDEKASVEGITKALSSLERMRPEDVAVVFFGGHGFKKSADAEMVFATGNLEVTIDPQTKKMKLNPASVDKHSIGWKTIGDLLSHAKGRVLVLLDACHSGHVSRNIVVPNNDLARALSASGRAGVVVFAAARGDQVSYEPSGERSLILTTDQSSLVKAASTTATTAPKSSATSTDASAAAAATAAAAAAATEPHGHGFFTGAVLQSLTTASTDWNRDGAIQVTELIEDVTRRVSQATSGAQIPWVARFELFGDFRLTNATK